MTSATDAESDLPSDVMSEIRRTHSEAEFQTFRVLVAERFTDACAIIVRLLDDPDESDRRWIVFEVRIPGSTTPEEYSERIKQFYVKLAERPPQVPWRRCALQLWSAGD
jgi:hypothetical protein